MEKIILIEQYLTGALNGEEKKDFEKRLQADESLQKEVDAYRDVINGIAYKGQEDFMKTVAGWEAGIRREESGNIQTETPVRDLRPFRNRFLAIAATVIALLAFAWLLWPNGSSDSDLIAQLSPSEAYEQYYSPFPDKISVRGRGERLMKTAIALYNDQQYAESLVKFDSLLVDSPTDDRMALYKGICQLEIEKPEEAVPLFERVSKGQSEFVEEGDWYLALAELKRGRIEVAKALFRNMAALENHDHMEEAVKILSQLE